MTTSLDNKLNLVIPVETSGGEVYVHSAPISRMVFGRYYDTIAKTFATIYSEKYSIYAGPRVALHIMRDIAQENGKWEGTSGVEAGLVAEIYRLTNVLAPGTQGWETIPYGEAVKRGTISEDDAEVIDNALAFFTVASSMHSKKDAPAILRSAAQLWSGLTTQSNCTEYAAGLPTSIVKENIGATAVKPLSLPS